LPKPDAIQNGESFIFCFYLRHMNIRSRTYEWEDPVPLASQASQLSGMEFLEKITNAELPLPPLIHTLDFKVSTILPGRAEFTFQPQEFHYNPLGSVHGGVITAILDSALGCTLHSVLPAGTGYTTVDIKVNFLKSISIKTGLMRAVGAIINQGNRTALLEARLTDENGKLYAYATSTCMILKSE
jgi:uncharacterized protein (TIGR00369 family)